MVESYLLETLFILCYKNGNGITLIRAIDGVAQLFPVKRQTLFLEFRMIYLLEAILFANIKDGIWRGKWEQRCYVVKRDGVLEYYTMYEAREFFWLIIDSALLTSTVKHTTNETIVNFELMWP